MNRLTEEKPHSEMGFRVRLIKCFGDKIKNLSSIKYKIHPKTGSPEVAWWLPMAMEAKCIFLLIQKERKGGFLQFLLSFETSSLGFPRKSLLRCHCSRLQNQIWASIVHVLSPCHAYHILLPLPSISFPLKMLGQILLIL